MKRPTIIRIEIERESTDRNRLYRVSRTIDADELDNFNGGDGWLLMRIVRELRAKLDAQESTLSKK